MKISEFKRLFAYHRWANADILKAFKGLEAVPARGMATFAHIMAADRLWYDRLQNGGEKIAVWPEWNLGQCESQLASVDSLWMEYLDGLIEPAVMKKVSYTNSKGEFFTNSVGDVLIHIVIHGAHHRGQIVQLIRQSGHIPPYTDYIHAVRSGFVE
jgi:uncharacterized damage-inducible protein DinB